MSIRVSSLTKVYGRRRVVRRRESPPDPAVDSISFMVQPGEIVGFLGPNGAGKSTTMKIATGYLLPTEGTIEINGFDIRTHSLDVRRSIGYLPEHNPLYVDMYVKEFLCFAGSLYNLRGSALTQRVDQLIELVGLVPEQRKKIGQLSKGYRQRVGLAQALIHDPSVLILDEPTTGLDPNQLSEIRQVIRDAGREKTVLFSTHIMQEVEALCDRVVIINRGRIVADGSLSKLREQALVGDGTDTAVIMVEFEEELNNTSLLTSLPGVRQVKTLSQGQYMITADRQIDIRAMIFRLAADKRLPLIGLKQQETSLEGIFRELTK